MPIVVTRRVRPSVRSSVRLSATFSTYTFRVTGMHIKLHIQVNYALSLTLSKPQEYSFRAAAREKWSLFRGKIVFFAREKHIQLQ